MLEINGTALYDPALQSRAQTKENERGEVGKGGISGGGRKGAPCHRDMAPGETFVSEIDGLVGAGHVILQPGRPEGNGGRNNGNRRFRRGRSAAATSEGV